MTSHKDNNKNNTSKTNRYNGRTNWKEVIEEVKSSLLWFKQLGVIPTLRTIFYRLVSLEIIPNTEQAKSLSSTTVKARKSGEIPLELFF